MIFYFKLKDFEKAKKDFEQVLFFSRNFQLEALKKLVEILYISGEYDSALNWIDIGKNLFENNNHLLKIFKAKILFDKKQYQEAKDVIISFEKLSYHDEKILLFLLKINKKLKDFHSNEKLFRFKLLKYSPKNLNYKMSYSKLKKSYPLIEFLQKKEVLIFTYIKPVNLDIIELSTKQALDKNKQKYITETGEIINKPPKNYSVDLISEILKETDFFQIVKKICEFHFGVKKNETSKGINLTIKNKIANYIKIIFKTNNIKISSKIKSNL